MKVPGRKRKRVIIIYRTIQLVNLSLVAALLFSYLGAYISPETFSLFAFFGLAYPILLVLNIVFVIHWIFQKKWYFLYSLIAILLGWSSIKNLYQISIFASKATSEESLKILSYNSKYFGRFLDTQDKLKVVNTIINTLDSVKADIICLQEFQNKEDSKNSSNIKSIFNQLGKMNYHFTVRSSNVNNSNELGMIIFTKFPIIDKGVLNFDNSSNMASFVDILYKKDTIRVYNIHLASIRFQNDDYQFIETIDSKKTENELKEGSRRIYGRLRLAFIKRAIQAKIVAKHIANSPYPVVLCGDFNDTSTSYAYNTLKGKKLKDTFTEKGKGFGKTYNGSFPSFRIDHILVDKSFTTNTYSILTSVDASDHYPLVAELSK